jgi:ATP-dependent helicase HrpB
VLCFLPGAPEIQRVLQRIKADPLPGDPDIVTLFGAMTAADQDRALTSGNRRKVILSTNVAETSLTIEGVTTVVDSGLMKSARWDSKSDRERLELVKISRASAEQRAGRAGRTRPGRCYRLWTEAEHAMLLPSHAPEIHRVELSRVLLDVALFTGADPRRFGFFEPPPKAHLDHAVELLQMLGALDDDGRPTARGRAIARLPLSPRAAAVLLAAADLDVVEDAAVAMAILEDDRALSALTPRTAAQTTDSDVQGLIERAEDDRRLPELRQAVRELVRLAPTPRVSDDIRREGPGRRLKRALLAGFPDRVCRRRRPGEADAAMVGGRGVKQLSESGVDAPLFLALSLEGRGAAAGVAVAESIELALLQDVAPHLVTVRDEAVLDDERGAFVGVRRTRFRDLIIEEKTGVPVNDDAVAEGLARTFAERFERLFAPDDATAATLTRLRFARQSMPDEEWPIVDDDALKALLPDLCLALVRKGRRRLEDVASADWHGAVGGLLDWQLKQRLDSEVPGRLTVPTGNAIAVDYGPALQGGVPVLAVRLQECFGWLDTPRVARGRIAVVLHLLSPGYKPVQVTTDLRSFWQRGYKEVKAELKARYPKHSWPDDPLAATPVAKGRSTRSS